MTAEFRQMIRDEYLCETDHYLPEIRVLECNYEFNVEFWKYRNSNWPFWMLWRTDSLGCILLFEGQKLSIESGQVVLVPPYTNFSTDNESRSFDQFYIHFLAEYPFNRVRKRPIFLDGSYCAPWISRIRQKQDTHAWKELMIYHIVCATLLAIPPSLFEAQNGHPADHRIEKALEFIHRHTGAPLCNQSIADAVQMSLNNFLKLFKEQIGVSPRQYFLAQKIEYSRMLLQNLALTIDEIAGQTGFIDRYHYSKTFKRFNGLSPVEYRKRFRRPCRKPE